MKKLFVLGIVEIIIVSWCNLTYAFGLVEKAQYRAQIAEERLDIFFDRQEAQIIKRYDAQLEKTLIDIHGNRVRVEEYVLRPQADQVKFLSLSHRKDSLNYLWFLQDFNKDLPEDITKIAFRWDWPNYPEWYATKQIIHLSNTIDSVEYEWTGEKPEVMDLINSNAEKIGKWWTSGLDSLRLSILCIVTGKNNENTQYPNSIHLKLDRWFLIVLLSYRLKCLSALS